LLKPQPRTKHEVDRMTRCLSYGHLKFSHSDRTLEIGDRRPDTQVILYSVFNAAMQCIGQTKTQDNVYVTFTEALNVPADGDVSKFTIQQLQQLMQHLDVPEGTLSEWRRLGVDGSKFAQMTDSQLSKYNVTQRPLVVYFRNHSRLKVLNHL